MQPARPGPQQRAPGSFSQQGNSNSNSTSAADSPPPRPSILPLNVAKSRSPTIQQQQQQQYPHPQQGGTPIVSFTSQPNSSTTSLQNFSRPTPSLSTAAARSVAANHDPSSRNPSPLTPYSASPGGGSRLHSRKHSQSAGVFEATLPSITTSNLPQIGAGMSHPSPVQRELPASHIAAQAAVKNNQLHQSQNIQQHVRQRSQTVPSPAGEPHDSLFPPSAKRGSGPLSPPMLSLTEASAPRESGFGSQGYHNGLLGSNAAATAANVVFPRSGQSSPIPPAHAPPPPPLPPPLPEKKAEKSSKVKLFSRPNKISTKGESKDKPLPSPSKIGSALSALQRGNFSTTSLDSSAQSFYSLGNSSVATIRPGEGTNEKEGREKKHHFLSRQRHKPKDKDDYHLQLSSAASNSRPTDPSAPSSLYNFNLPSSPGTNSGTFKTISGLDLRHGGRALRQGRKDDRVDPNESMASQTEWPGPSSLNSTTGPVYMEPIDSGKYGLNSMSLDDAWPYLRAKLLVIFEGGDLRLPVEDFNRVVTMHIQYCIQRRSPNIIVEDLRDMLTTGFSSLDHTLRKESEDRLIPSLVDLWILTFTTIMPYMQAVLLPLDLEFAGAGTLMTPDQARDFWGGVLASQSPAENSSTIGLGLSVSPASAVLDVRRMLLTAYRDVVILPRYDRLKTIFSRLSLEFLPHSLASMALASPRPESYLSTSPGAESSASFSYQQQRPGTAMSSLDPATASFNSTSTTLLGDIAGGNRSRGLSNVSFASSGNHSDSAASLRPPKLTAGSSSNLSLSGSLRDQNVEDSKQVTEMVGRMLQCMSVLASVGAAGDRGDEGNKMVEELSRLLKLNWLGRGRTGRNRRGIVGGRVRRGCDQASILEEALVM